LAEGTAGQEESFDSLLKRFNRKVQQDGILAELRRREHYEKPSVRRKRKKAAKKRGAARSNRIFRRASTR
jgi:small subunit ribosomal protein S21